MDGHGRSCSDTQKGATPCELFRREARDAVRPGGGGAGPRGVHGGRDPLQHLVAHSATATVPLPNTRHSANVRPLLQVRQLPGTRAIAVQDPSADPEVASVRIALPHGGSFVCRGVRLRRSGKDAAEMLEPSGVLHAEVLRPSRRVAVSLPVRPSDTPSSALGAAEQLQPGPDGVFRLPSKVPAGADLRVYGCRGTAVALVAGSEARPRVLGEARGGGNGGSGLRTGGAQCRRARTRAS